MYIRLSHQQLMFLFKKNLRLNNINNVEVQTCLVEKENLNTVNFYEKHGKSNQ